MALTMAMKIVMAMPCIGLPTKALSPWGGIDKESGHDTDLNFDT